MSEVEFKTVSAFVSHLEESGNDTVETAYVVDTIKAIQAQPKSTNRRGQLAGVSLEDMTDEQLKRELINAKSVLYKAQQREASPETIEKNQARVDAALEEKAKRQPAAAEATDEEPIVAEEDIEI